MDASTKLIKRFYRNFFHNLIWCLILIIVPTAISINYWIKYHKFATEVIAAIIPTAISLLFLILSFVALLPYFRDFPAIRKKQFNRIIGIVVRFRKIVDQSGEYPTTYGFNPIVKDADENEIELKIKGTLLNQKNIFLYLKFTKLAIIES